MDEGRRVEATQLAIKKLWERVLIKGEDECWLWPGSCAFFGYGRIVCLGVSFTAHRLAYLSRVGPIEGRLLVRHKCDVPACCNPKHLELGTHQDNSNDMVARGRHIYQKRPEPRMSAKAIAPLRVPRSTAP